VGLDRVYFLGSFFHPADLTIRLSSWFEALFPGGFIDLNQAAGDSPQLHFTQRFLRFVEGISHRECFKTVWIINMDQLARKNLESRLRHVENLVDPQSKRFRADAEYDIKEQIGRFVFLNLTPPFEIYGGHFSPLRRVLGFWSTWERSENRQLDLRFFLF
jgi:hypothetical protein